MHFDRFDICNAWYLALSHCHGGQWSREYARLCQLQKRFKPSPLLSVGYLNENARAIYNAACNRLLQESWDKGNDFQTEESCPDIETAHSSWTESARKQLEEFAALFNPADYPSADEIRERFRFARMNWKVYIIENGEEKLIYNNRWCPTIDDMSVVSAVQGKKYKVISPQGKDVTAAFPYGMET